jgi:hypothetical protein
MPFVFVTMFYIAIFQRPMLNPFKIHKILNLVSKIFFGPKSTLKYDKKCNFIGPFCG